MNNAVKSIIGILIILAISFVLLGMFVPQFNYYSKVIVNKPVDQAYSVFMDEETLPKWLTGLKSIKLIEGQKDKPGSVYELVLEEDGREFVVTEEIVKIKLNAEFAFRLESDMFTNYVRVRFVERSQNEVAIVQSNRIRGKNIFMRSILFLSKGRLEDASLDNYNKLKAIIEQS